MKHTIKELIRKTIIRCPKAFVMLTGLFISMAAASQAFADVAPANRKEIKVTRAFQKLEVQGDVTVILSNGPASEILLEGNDKDIRCVRISLKNGELKIDAEKKKSFEKLIVTVSARNITLLVINGDAEIFSSGRIRAHDLEIILNGVSLVAVDYAGKIKIKAGEGYDIEESRR